MKNTYFDLIDQSYYFPQEGFDLKDGYLTFHGVSLKYLIEKYGTPFKLMYLPRIGEQIKKARNSRIKSLSFIDKKKQISRQVLLRILHEVLPFFTCGKVSGKGRNTIGNFIII